MKFTKIAKDIHVVQKVVTITVILFRKQSCYEDTRADWLKIVLLRYLTIRLRAGPELSTG